MNNPFINTVARKEVTKGEKRLIGGTFLRITSVNRTNITLKLGDRAETCISLSSLGELVSILTEIHAVMKENRSCQ